MNENLLERRDSYSLHSLNTHSFRASDCSQLAFSFFPNSIHLSVSFIKPSLNPRDLRLN